MSTLLFLILLILGAGVWWYLSDTREMALREAKRYCYEMQVQFLDGSVMSDGVRLIRNSSDRLQLVQRFRFEFTTTGEQRYSGLTELVGRRVIKMELEPHRL